jgi:hypothetical protein
MSPLRVLRQIVKPIGRHRAPARERVEVALDDLLGPVPDRTPPYGAAVVQAWRDCPACAKVTAGVLHADGRTCGECLTTTPDQP